jgi:hypothetical protein
MDCDVILYKDQDHAFFNIDNNEELHFKTMADIDFFLTYLGYLQGKATVNKFKKNLNNE